MTVFDIVRELDDGAIQRMNREITAAEMGLMLRLAPADVRDRILSRCVAPGLREDVVRIAEGENPEMDVASPCMTCACAGYGADTPEKAVEKYQETFETLRTAGEI